MPEDGEIKYEGGGWLVYDSQSSAWVDLASVDPELSNALAPYDDVRSGIDGQFEFHEPTNDVWIPYATAVEGKEPESSADSTDTRSLWDKFLDLLPGDRSKPPADSTLPKSAPRPRDWPPDLDWPPTKTDAKTGKQVYDDATYVREVQKEVARIAKEKKDAAAAKAGASGSVADQLAASFARGKATGDFTEYNTLLKASKGIQQPAQEPKSWATYDEANTWLKSQGQGSEGYKAALDPTTGQYVIKERDASDDPRSIDGLMAKYVSQAIIDGNWDAANQIWEFKNQPTIMERFKAATDIASSPADYFTVLAMARGQAPIQAQPGTFQRIAPESQIYSVFGFGNGKEDSGRRLNQSPTAPASTTSAPFQLPGGEGGTSGGAFDIGPATNPSGAISGLLEGANNADPFGQYDDARIQREISGLSDSNDPASQARIAALQDEQARRFKSIQAYGPTDSSGVALGPGSNQTQLGAGTAFSPTTGMSLTETPDQQAVRAFELPGVDASGQGGMPNTGTANRGSGVDSRYKTAPPVGATQEYYNWRRWGDTRGQGYGNGTDYLAEGAGLPPSARGGSANLEPFGYGSGAFQFAGGGGANGQSAGPEFHLYSDEDHPGKVGAVGPDGVMQWYDETDKAGIEGARTAGGAGGGGGGGNIFDTEPGLAGIRKVGIEGGVLGYAKQFPEMGGLKFPSGQAWSRMLPSERAIFQRAVQMQGIDWNDYESQWRSTMPGGGGQLGGGGGRQRAFTFGGER